MWGAAVALREEIGVPLPPSDQAECDRLVASARHALGNEAFSQALAEGRAMGAEASIELALRRDDE